ncbi:MAG: DUF2797 domain-containing protein [Flavobacteriales bacterium]|nr:MAG: DUF2797 domain-containing protein [Flavobacteriales bacterium]
MAQGQLVKMSARLEEGRVHYTMHLGADAVDMNALIGRPLTVRFTGELSCINCNSRVKKFYGQGFCWNCLQTAPEASECIVRPELCRAHLGEGRDPQWENDHHNTEHFVYLSQSGGFKVGVTRATQIPTRWIDQGAVQAVIIARTPYRQLAGLIEVELKKHFADKTNWRTMLTAVAPDRTVMDDLRTKAMQAMAVQLGAYALDSEEPLTIQYPVLAHPPKVTSVGLEKVPVISGTLCGIKGQYLLWDDGRVFNVRNHSGYHVALE